MGKVLKHRAIKPCYRDFYEQRSSNKEKNKREQRHIKIDENKYRKRNYFSGRNGE